jgi:hypothetical protein
VVKRSLIFGVLRAAALAAVGLAATAFGVAAFAASTAAAPGNSFVTHNLVSDQAGKADHVDPNLVKPGVLRRGSTRPGG